MGGGGYIITNGLLLLQQPDLFWRRCKENSIEIRITKYPIKLDFDRIAGKAKSYGVKLTYMYDTDKLEKNMHHLPFDLNEAQNIKNLLKYVFLRIMIVLL